MFDDLVIHEYTRHELQKFMLRTNPGCLILYGKRHMGKATVAKKMAEIFLEKDIVAHPDFMLVEPDEGTVRIEQVRAMVEKSRLMPVESGRQVFIVDEADTMSAAAQNALLKLVEDGNGSNIIIFISNGGLLDTIKSRCTQIEFVDCDIETSDAVLDLLADGCPGIPVLYKDSEFLASVKAAIACLNSSPQDILKVMHAIKEKDKEFFFEKYSLEEVRLFNMCLREYYAKALLQILFEDRKARVVADGVCARDDLERVCKLANLAEKQANSKNYNKNDFVGWLLELALG